MPFCLDAERVDGLLSISFRPSPINNLLEICRPFGTTEAPRLTQKTDDTKQSKPAHLDEMSDFGESRARRRTTPRFFDLEIHLYTNKITRLQDRAFLHRSLG
jgi:hypothetical protein